MVQIKIRRQWRNNMLKQRYKERGLKLEYGKNKMIKYIPTEGFLKMSKTDQKKSLEWKRKIALIFDFIDDMDKQDFDIVFGKGNHSLCCRSAILMGKYHMEHYTDFFLWGLDFDIENELYGIIHMYLKFLGENGIFDISRSSYKVAAAIMYNKAVNLGLSNKKGKFNKLYFARWNNASDRTIKNLCLKFGIPYDKSIFDDIEKTTQEVLDPVFLHKMKTTDWLNFLKSLLPEIILKEFECKISYSLNVRTKYGHYLPQKHEIKCFIYQFRNDWDKVVDTMLHEFCHHLEECGVFSHYKYRTHTPLFYAAIRILQNKSVLMGINLSDDIYDLSELEKDCSVGELETLCRDLGVEYKDVKNLKTERKAG